jgi:hypothetical protein
MVIGGIKYILMLKKYDGKSKGAGGGVIISNKIPASCNKS